MAQTCTDRPAVEFLDRGSSFLALAGTGEGVEQCSLADRIFIGRSNRVHAVVTRTFFDLAEAVVALKFGRAAGNRNTDRSREAVLVGAFSS